MLILEESIVGHEQYITFAFASSYLLPLTVIYARRFPSSYSAVFEALRNFFFGPNPRSRTLRSLFRRPDPPTVSENALRIGRN